MSLKKTVSVESPHAVFSGFGNANWEWHVLKTYKTPANEAKDPYARWFCLVKSPFIPEGELGDVYVCDITYNATLKTCTDEWKEAYHDV